MNYLAVIELYDFATSKWLTLSDLVTSWIKDLKVSLSDFDADSATITFEMPDDIAIINNFINERLFIEGTPILIGLGYNNHPELFEPKVFNGIIVSTLPEFGVNGTKVTITAADPTIQLKAKVVNTQVLNKLARDKDPVGIVRYILDSVACKKSWRENKVTKKYSIIESETPKFGFKYNSTTIPDLTEEEKKFHRFVQGSKLKDAQLETSEAPEFGKDNESNMELLSKAGSQKGFEIHETYIETIRAMEVACGRLFWYDSNTGLVHFESPKADVDSNIKVLFYGDGRYYGTDIFNNPLKKEINRIYEFAPDYSAIDVSWLIKSNLVSITKANDTVKTELLTIHSNPEDTTVAVANNTVAKNTPNLFGDEFLTSFTDSWKSKKQISPDSYEVSMTGYNKFKIKEFTVTGKGILKGNPFLKPRDLCHIGMIGSKFSGYWFINSITHTISLETGFVTGIDVSRNVVGIPSNLEVAKVEEVAPQNPKLKRKNSKLENKPTESKKVIPKISNIIPEEPIHRVNPEKLIFFIESTLGS